MPEQGSSARVEELLARMDVVDKVGQLIQYFFFSLPTGAETPDALDFDAAAQPRAVEAALARGGAGSLLFQTDPGEIDRLQHLVVEGNRHGIPARCVSSTRPSGISQIPKLHCCGTAYTSF